MLGMAFLITAVAIIGIWILVEFKRMRHKIFALFLIFVILFSYMSVSYVFKNENVDLGTVRGLFSAGKIYFSWLSGVLSNIKTTTSNVIKMDWIFGNSSR
jgi:hypothetical protein